MPRMTPSPWSLPCLPQRSRRIRRWSPLMDGSSCSSRATGWWVATVPLNNVVGPRAPCWVRASATNTPSMASIPTGVWKAHLPWPVPTNAPFVGVVMRIRWRPPGHIKRMIRKASYRKASQGTWSWSKMYLGSTQFLSWAWGYLNFSGAN